jgi:O-antigen ligase
MAPTDVTSPSSPTPPVLPTAPRPRAPAVLRVQQARAQYRRPVKRPAAPFVGDGTTWGPLERANGVLFVAFVAVLTLEWISLTGAGGGQIKYFHVAAIGFIVTFSLRYRPRQTIAPYLVANRTFYVPYVVYLCAVGAGGFVHTPPEFTHSDLIRQLFYSGTGIFVGAFIAVSYNRRVRQYFLYTGIAAVSVLLVMMTFALGQHGTNPVSVFIQAMKTQNPDILTNDLLKGTFRSQDLAAAGANLRHKVFAAVLIGVYVSLMYMPKDLRVRRRGTWRVVIFFAVLGVLLVFVSLSRSIMICVIVAVGLVALRVFLRAKATPRTALAYSAVVAGALLVLVSPMGGLLQQRFFDQTSSYTARSSAVSNFMGIAGKAAVSGLSATQITFTPHNIILDAWLSGGVIAALAAAGFVGWLALLWVREVHRYLFSAGGWYLSANQFFVMAIGFEPLVRAFTAGDGFHMTEWTCVGIFLGSLYANSIAARDAPAQHAAAASGGRATAVPGRVVTPTLADALAARTARLRASRSAARRSRRSVTVRRGATVPGARPSDSSTRVR